MAAAATLATLIDGRETAIHGRKRADTQHGHGSDRDRQHDDDDDDEAERGIVPFGSTIIINATRHHRRRSSTPLAPKPERPSVPAVPAAIRDAAAGAIVDAGPWRTD